MFEIFLLFQETEARAVKNHYAAVESSSIKHETQSDNLLVSGKIVVNLIGIHMKGPS